MKSKNLFQSVKDVPNGKIALSIFTFSTTFIAGFAAATVALGLKGGYHNSSIAEAIICGLILLFYGIYGTYKLYKLNKVKVKLTTNKFRERLWNILTGKGSLRIIAFSDSLFAGFAVGAIAFWNRSTGNYDPTIELAIIAIFSFGFSIEEFYKLNKK